MARIRIVSAELSQKVELKWYDDNIGGALDHVSIKNTVFQCMGISIIKIKRSRDRLFFLIWISVLARRQVYIERVSAVSMPLISESKHWKNIAYGNMPFSLLQLSRKKYQTFPPCISTCRHQSQLTRPRKIKQQRTHLLRWIIFKTSMGAS